MDAPAANGHNTSGATNGDTMKLPLRPKPDEEPATNGSSSIPNGNVQTSSATQQDKRKEPATQNGPGQDSAETNLEKEHRDQHSVLSSLSASELSKLANKKKGPPGGLDATPLPSVPQGYTIRFTFRSAANLPPSDLNTASSDPYLTATLRAPSVKRHK